MVREHIDTIDALMARFVAGSLPLPAQVLVESHLELKPDYRNYVSDLEAMAGVALEDVKPSALSNRDALLDNIFSSNAGSHDIRLPKSPVIGAPSDGILPRPLREFIGLDVEDIPWRTKIPGFKEYDVGDFDGCHVSMFWIKPGRTVPAHTHEGCELSLVLDGAFNDATGRYGRGDISVADDTIDHRPIAEADRPCIGFAVVDAPLKLTGSFRQLIGDIIG